MGVGVFAPNGAACHRQATDRYLLHLTELTLQIFEALAAQSHNHDVAPSSHMRSFALQLGCDRSSARLDFPAIDLSRRIRGTKSTRIRCGLAMSHEVRESLLG
jgi:hypothetical protein